MKFNEVINEDLNFVKFFYQRFKHDPNPHIIVLDNHYKYDGKGNIKYNKDGTEQDDVLAYNVDYAEESKDAKRAIDEIDTFAKMLDKNKKDVYERIKELYPSSLKYIRHYKKDAMKNMKILKDKKWKTLSSIDTLEDPDF